MFWNSYLKYLLIKQTCDPPPVLTNYLTMIITVSQGGRKLLKDWVLKERFTSFPRRSRVDSSGTPPLPEYVADRCP